MHTDSLKVKQDKILSKINLITSVVHNSYS